MVNIIENASIRLITSTLLGIPTASSDSRAEHQEPKFSKYKSCDCSIETLIRQIPAQRAPLTLECSKELIRVHHLWKGIDPSAVPVTVDASVDCDNSRWWIIVSSTKGKNDCTLASSMRKLVRMF
ncbi:hypothetical protein BC938DRAFT_481931 [Jimgerdemannia flammicorona]|uniref:Uncharacterized protein n=1 Tax=Jimgerdemannia flammicorona TaxID=994334 RepID=A0A433QF67_9FUNG|nr:hypothetical protein BC938DRAFT_481931 [Jimgerdemannia flammicorona]